LNNNTEDQMARAAPRTIAIGNPGAGKSTMLNALWEQTLFRSEISFGGGLTSRLDRKNNSNGLFYDTPGLADDTYRKQAAEAIRDALRDGGPFKYTFFLSEASRVINEDIAILKLVHEACPEISNSHGIMINQVSQDFVHGLKEDVRWCSNSKIRDDFPVGSYEIGGSGGMTSNDFGNFIHNLPAVHRKVLQNQLENMIGLGTYEKIISLMERGRIRENSSTEIGTKAGRQQQGRKGNIPQLDTPPMCIVQALTIATQRVLKKSSIDVNFDMLQDEIASGAFGNWDGEVLLQNQPPIPMDADETTMDISTIQNSFGKQGSATVSKGHFCKPCQSSHPWLSQPMQVDELLIRYIENQANGEICFFNIVVREKQGIDSNNEGGEMTHDQKSETIFVDKENPCHAFVGEKNALVDGPTEAKDIDIFSIDETKFECFTVNISNFMAMRTK